METEQAHHEREETEEELSEVAQTELEGVEAEEAESVDIRVVSLALMTSFGMTRILSPSWTVPTKGKA